MRSLLFSFSILLLGSSVQAVETASGQASVKETAKQARALFKQRRYPEAAALARQVFLQAPSGREADDLRVLLCEARFDGADIGDPTAAYPARPASMVGPSRPEKISGAGPQFGTMTRQAGQTGTVLVMGKIDQDGCVKDLRVERSLNLHADQDVMNAVRRWVFRPALLDGKPMEIHYNVQVSVSFEPQ